MNITVHPRHLYRLVVIRTRKAAPPTPSQLLSKVFPLNGTAHWHF